MSSSELTLSFMPSEQHQVVFHSRWIVGKRELQLELVVEAEARDGGISHKGSVTELIASTEPGASYVDACKTNAVTITFSSYLCSNVTSVGWCGCLCGVILFELGENRSRFIIPLAEHQKMALLLHITHQGQGKYFLFWVLLHDDLFSNTITSSALFYFH